MKLIIVGLLVTFSYSLHALTIDFVGPCEKEPFHSVEIEESDAHNVGELSIKVLEDAKISFIGSDLGINQILNTPIGLDAMEIISNREMMSYGWCFEVDGTIPEVYPNQVGLEGAQHIRWFFGYAHYLAGEWLSQCEKSYLRRAAFLCSQ